PTAVNAPQEGTPFLCPPRYTGTFARPPPECNPPPGNAVKCAGGGVAPRHTSADGSGLDGLHVPGREAKMMPDFMHQDVGAEVAQRLLALGPTIEDRAAVEKYHVRRPRQVHYASLVHADALVEAQEIERALNPHFAQNFLGREVIDP